MSHEFCSTRLKKVQASPIRKLVPFALEAKKQGVHVYHLNIGDPDVKTPEVMIDVLRQWEKNPIGYDHSKGNAAFIDALIGYYHKLGFGYLKPADIQVATGGSEAISMAFFATCEAGDEVIVFEPFYTNYNGYATVNDVKLVPILTKIENGFHLPAREEIEKKITPKTRAILYCNPNNPTGTVYTKEEIEMLVDIAKKYNLFLMSDEVYREYAYDGRKQISLLHYMPQLPKQLIVLDSLSKRYSLCGARLGVLISLNSDIMEGILRIGQARLSSGLVDQAIGAALKDVPDSYFAEVHKEYETRRDVLFEGLKKVPGIVIPRPEGAFYSIVKLPVKDSEHFAQWLLTDFRDNNETVMVAPAGGFYAQPDLGKHEVRIAYVLNAKDLKRSIEIIEKALAVYPQKI
ncbi:pyridoxal phosphate-dependent aminotransferase [Candidatus Peregrinibacteria bacterium]|nr:pyridoxal phosphate-dependent aminotransferase [Candidatus Peregrinibacteria bacterium]